MHLYPNTKIPSTPLGRFFRKPLIEKSLSEYYYGLGFEYTHKFDTNYRKNDLRIAKYCFKTALRCNPENVDANIGLAAVHIRLRSKRHLRKAEKLLENALEKKPGVAEIKLNLGRVYNLRGELSKAIAIIEEAKQISPTHPTINLDLAEMYLKRLQEDNKNPDKNDIDRIKQCLKIAISSNFTPIRERAIKWLNKLEK
ncbi:tetratricopeptide repeat protein [Candidatus Micrarchaeota archaeon]|jgi:tetratricopeptide (TPR) repeat protein|nr:tetratricopeptide repeat protein [Candidatus Micrarchaeota archaeon]